MNNPFSVRSNSQVCRRLSNRLCFLKYCCFGLILVWFPCSVFIFWIGKNMYILPEQFIPSLVLILLLKRDNHCVKWFKKNTLRLRWVDHFSVFLSIAAFYCWSKVVCINQVSVEWLLFMTMENLIQQWHEGSCITKLLSNFHNQTLFERCYSTQWLV